MKNQFKSFLTLGIVVGTLSIQACTTVQNNASAATPEQIVAGRVEARWKALIEGRLETAYDFLSPATRETLPFIIYRGRTKPGMWREAKAKSVSCEAELCTAKVWLRYDVNKIKGLELDFEEFWIKENGSWWYVPKK